uniref:Tubulin polyglutamylase TTLL11-like isoform X3 n=1 Tax=Crassostrea virginica TaxID=6565 RepID=A0A8B8DD05_CRAVI|nr:tubulin polyglutamylase TTLL11-like isoform X3 [Crassostrea virginica]
MAASKSLLDSLKKPEPTNFRMTDFRRELHLRHKREEHAKKEKLRALQESKYVSRYAITIDTSRARSNCDVLRMSIKELGFKEYPFGRKDNCCDVHWHACHFEENPEVFGGKVNKFPGMSEICSKMTLFRCLDIMRDLFPTDYDFYPRTWYLPAQFHEFSCEIRKMHERRVKPKPTFIIKPDTGAQGDGIYLLREPNEYSSLSGKCHVAQEYMSNVYLIDKFKFDFRIYVLLKSLEPLEFYICQEGLARFSTLPYENPTNKNIHESFMHLTNYSLNKRSSTFNRSDRDDEGSKRTLTSVLRRIAMNGHDSNKVWKSIERIVCKTIVAIVPEMKVEYQAAIPPGKTGPSCFQVLGFDILLLQNLKPILLEINASPSLSLDSEQEVSPGVFEYVLSPKDEEVKYPLIRDTLLHVVPIDKLKYFRKKKKQRLLKKLKASTSQKGKRPDPPVKQRTSIVIIKADESDEEKREVNVTQQMSEMHMDVDSHGDGTARDVNSDDERESNIKSDTELDEEVDNYFETKLRESCLKQLYPAIYDEECERYRILERVAGLFIFFLGIRGSLRIGPTGFRTFARKCRLNRKGMTNASVDIMYIDLQRRWDHMNPERTSGSGIKSIGKKGNGLCYQGFLDACIEIARRKFYAPTKIEMLENLVDHCELNLNLRDNDLANNLPRLHFRRLGLQYRQGSMYAMPRRVIDQMTEETTIEDLLKAHEKKLRQPSREDIEAFLRKSRRMIYQPSSGSRVISVTKSPDSE